MNSTSASQIVMNKATHFCLLAKYNSRMNRQLIDAASTLNQEALIEDKGAFFQSILGTMNHILAGDIFWLRRFYAQQPQRFSELQILNDLPSPTRLDDMLFDNLSDYAAGRFKLDEGIENWITSEVTEDDFSGYIAYRNSRGEEHKKSFSEVLFHLFNHQTHHRGQITTLFSQLDVSVGHTDFIFDIPEWA